MRKKPTQATEKSVLVRSGRRCALCFGLHGDLAIKRGQIAHLDRNSSNSAETNLVYLCLPHHDEYDSITSQSKGLTIAELVTYRERLYAQVALEQSRGQHMPTEKVLGDPSRNELKLPVAQTNRAMTDEWKSVINMAKATSTYSANDRILLKGMDRLVDLLTVDQAIAFMRAAATYSNSGELLKRFVQNRLRTTGLSAEERIKLSRAAPTYDLADWVIEA